MFFAFGSITILNWLDPYSIFGRFSTYFFKPVLVWGNNLLAHILESRNIYFFYNVSQKPLQLGVYIIPVILLIVIIRLSVKNGRIFCNSICPVGSILGLISKVSFFKISIDNDTCTSCGLCERVCKAKCMNFKEFYVDVTRCVGCYNCLTVCKSDSVKYNFSIPKLKFRKPKAINTGKEHDENRRKVITGTFAYILALAGLSMRNARAASQQYKLDTLSNDTTASDTIVTRHMGLVPVDDRGTITPPGSIDINHFTSKCTACSLCVSACPTRVLQPSFLEYGFLGIMQPHMEFKSGFCNYDCIKCTEVCPTGAILPQELEPKKLIQLGIAKFVKKNCIVETKGKDCGACSEHCPTKACHMVPYKDTVVIPEVTEDLCIGCGACEHVCPAEPYLAIYIEANKEHKEAEKPKTEKLEEIEFEDEFPF
ncbi:4Fe-4S binding protein [Bacteroidota bacterium]